MSLSVSPLTPCLTLHQIYGPDVFFYSGYAETFTRWIVPSSDAWGLSSGQQLPVMGKMPLVCSAGTVTPVGLNLLEEAGISSYGSIYAHRDGERTRLLSELASGGVRFAMQGVFPDRKLDPSLYIVPRDLLQFLNNKANLKELVQTPYLPRRQILAEAELDQLLSYDKFPVFLKVATDESNGGGGGVFLCKGPDQLAGAKKFFSGCDRVIIEEYLRMKRSICLNYAVMSNGEVVYIGGAEQVCTPEGIYTGSWIEDEDAPSEAVTAGSAVASAAAVRGYRGIVGIDTALTPDGRVFFFDLNFRFNGSTTALLLRDSIRLRFSDAVMRLRSWNAANGYAGMVKIIRSLMKRGLLIPLCTYDPQAAGNAHSPARFTGLLLGETRGQIEKLDAELAGLGLKGC